MTQESLLHAVADAARVAGDVALSHYRSALVVETKRDGSPVTVADRSAELAARGWIAARFPADGVTGEEGDDEHPGARRRWLIDPIDGTKSFVRGVPLWGTLVAVAEGELVLAGAAYFPALGETVAAAGGEGCWHNGRRCRVSEVAELSAATVLTTDDRFRAHPERKPAFDTLATKAAVSRSWGDCFGYFLVATGRAEVMVDDIVNAWDTAAMYPIVTEAGGVFTDWSGRDTGGTFGDGAIATNAALARVTRGMLLSGPRPARTTKPRGTHA